MVLLEEFREGLIRFHDAPDWVFVHPVGVDFDKTEHRILGNLRLPADATNDLLLFWVSVLEDQAGADWCERFVALAVNAGARLPLTLKDALSYCSPSTSFAWWIAVMWAYWYPTPSTFPTRVGSVMMNVFDRSVRAIERCEHFKVIGSAAGDTWSVPMSKAEIARRTTSSKRLSRTQQNKALAGLEIRQALDDKGNERRNSWIVRLDGLSPELRDRFLRP